MSVSEILKDLQDYVAELEKRGDPDELIAASAALWDVILDHKLRRTRRTPPKTESGTAANVCFSRELAKSFADGSWRRSEL